MAHKKGVGSSKNGRESESKRLGVKIFGGQVCKAGMGKDHTIYALIDGTVLFTEGRNGRKFINVTPLGEA